MTARPTRLPILLLTAMVCCLSSVSAADPANEASEQDQAGFFYPLAGAKDCAYDQERQRLYITTHEKLVVFDTKARKLLESVELGGKLQACDIAPDFSFLVVAPIAAQYVYRIKLAWEQIEDMEVSQIKFRGDSSETGVFSIAVGSDNTTIFSTTYAGSGGVTLRRLDAKSDAIEDIGRINMDTVLTSSGNRDLAAVAEGNISSAPLHLYDFKEQKLKHIADLGDFNYEIACASGGKYFARPNRNGCDLYDRQGGRLGTLEGAPVIAAAFHPKSDALFVMRHGEPNIQEYDVQGKKQSHAYPLDKPLIIRGDVLETVTLQPVGRAAVLARFRQRVNFHAYASGRLKVAENGETLFAVIPGGVYSFRIKAAAAEPPGNQRKPKIKVVEPSSPE